MDTTTIAAIVTGIATIVSSTLNFIQHRQKRTLRDQKKVTETEKSKVEQRLPKELIYTLILDGTQNCGKSSLVYRLMNPGGDITKLQKTMKPHESQPWPVIWKKGTDKRELYCIKAQDIPGEQPQAAHDLADGVEMLRGVLVIVAAADGIDDALKKFTKDYIQGVYFPKRLSDKINAVMIFVNKIDLIESSKRKQFEMSMKEKLNPVVLAINQKYPETKILFGSALTQENLFELVAEIHRKMNINECFESHPSIAGADNTK